jgi:hypothetical protein
MKAFYFFFILVINSNLICGQASFNRRYYSTIDSQTNRYFYAASCLYTKDNFIFLVGSGYTNYKMSAIKLSIKGDTIWSNVSDLGITNLNYLTCAVEAVDSNYVVTGIGTTENPGYTHPLLIKFDKDTGDTIWFKKLGQSNVSEKLFTLKKTIDNGFILGGTKIIEDSLGTVYQGDVYIVKTDSLGTVKWERSFLTPEADWINAVETTTDGGYLLFGCTRNFGLGAQSMYLVKTDSLGNMLWNKTYGGDLEDWGLAITKLQDGNFVLTGTSLINSNDYSSVAIKVNSDGDVIWYNEYEGPYGGQEFTGVKQLVTGEIAICGHTRGDTIGTGFLGILKLLNPNDGSIYWEKEYQYYNNLKTDQYIYGMDICKDGGFVLAGMTRNFNAGEGPYNAMWVVKTDCMGNDSIWDNASCPLATDVPNSPIPFNLYPNPTNGHVTVDYFIPENATSNQLTFYDASGKKVQTFTLTGEGQVQQNLDCSAFASGVYQGVVISDGEVVEQRKLVIIQ